MKGLDLPLTSRLHLLIPTLAYLKNPNPDTKLTPQVIKATAQEKEVMILVQRQ
jgi:hypothetical protein